MDEVMNLPQLASYLKMSQASVYHLLAAGKIPGTKVGKQWRFSRATISKWLQDAGRQSASILVVEDDEVVRSLVVGALSSAGHQCFGTDSADKAAALLHDIEFDLVLLDLLIRGGTGIDVVVAALQLKKMPEIVVITGYPKHEMVDQVRSLLPDVRVFNKPVRLAALVDLASRVAVSPTGAAVCG